MDIAKSLWPEKNLESARMIPNFWFKKLIRKGILPKNAKKIPSHKKINYDDLSKEQLIEIIKIYDKYNEIMNEKSKKNKFKAIANFESKHFSILMLCKIFGVSKSGYYKYLQTKINSKTNINSKLSTIINRIYNDNYKNYGYRKIAAEIERITKRKYNHKRIYRLMKIMGLKAEIRIKNARPKKELKSNSNKHGYLIDRNFMANKPLTKLYTDVTYIAMSDHTNAYLSPIIDGYNNQILSYSFSVKNDKSIIMKPLKEVVAKLDKKCRPIINSDHGLIYFSSDYQKLAGLRFKISMSRIGNCLDNRPIEYWFSIFKSERLYKIPIKERSFNRVRDEIDEFISYYNKDRIQECLGYLSPLEYLNK